MVVAASPDDGGAAHKRGGVPQDAGGNGIEGTSIVGKADGRLRVSAFVRLRGVRGSDRV
jgi:hypothetical protein